MQLTWQVFKKSTRRELRIRSLTRLRLLLSKLALMGGMLIILYMGVGTLTKQQQRSFKSSGTTSQLVLESKGGLQSKP